MRDRSIELYERQWPAQRGAWAKVLLIHGIAEHLGRYERTAGLLAAAGLAVSGFDLPGHGRSGGRRVYVERWDDYLDEVEAAVGKLKVENPMPVVLFGHSMGALIALSYALSGRRPAPDLLVLSAPALDARVPGWQRMAAPILSRVAPTHVIENPIRGSQLARDPAVGEAYFNDPLVQPRSTARLGHELFSAMARTRANLDRLNVPTLAIHGGDDTLVPAEVSAPLARIPVVERRVLSGLRHETLNEPEGPEIVAQIVAWLRAHLPPRREG